MRSKMAKLFSQTRENLDNSFNKYRQYYDRKAKAAPLKLRDYCMLLNPYSLQNTRRSGTWNANGQDCLELKEFLLEETIQ